METHRRMSKIKTATDKPKSDSWRLTPAAWQLSKKLPLWGGPSGAPPGLLPGVEPLGFSPLHGANPQRAWKLKADSWKLTADSW